MNTIDLHMHSNYSDDGSYPPSELMELCKKAGLTLVSLTDHDSAKGTREAAARAKELGMEFVSGVELDCMCKGTELHLLGYGIDAEDERMHQVEDEVMELFRKASADRVQSLKKLGIYFDEDEVWAGAWNGKIVPERFGEVALKDERNREHPLMKELFPGGSRSDSALLNFYWDIFAPGKPAHVKIEFMSFERAQKLITDLGGVSVLAHPGQTVGKNEALIRYMAEMGVCGMEVNSSYHTLEQAVYYEKLAEELQLLKTAGSDFHGEIKPHVSLGAVPGTVSKKDADALLRLIQERR